MAPRTPGRMIHYDPGRRKAAHRGDANAVVKKMPSAFSAGGSVINWKTALVPTIGTSAVLMYSPQASEVIPHTHCVDAPLLLAGDGDAEVSAAVLPATKIRVVHSPRVLLELQRISECRAGYALIRATGGVIVQIQ